MQLVALAVVAVLSACGASSAQLQMARAAQYTAPPATILELAKAVTAENYTVEPGSPAPNTFVTRRQWYAKEGGRQSAGAGNVSQVSEGSVNLRLAVEIVELEGGRVSVVVTPDALQYVTGSPKPRELAPEDPEMPPWIHGRVNELAVAIYERAKPYVAKP